MPIVLLFLIHTQKKDNDFEYDIYAEDGNNRKFYFVVKISKNGMYLSPKEKNFALMLKNSTLDNNYGIVLINELNKVSLQWFGKMKLTF